VSAEAKAQRKGAKKLNMKRTFTTRDENTNQYP